MVKKATTLTFILLSFFVNAQCDSTLLKETVKNGCSIVEMSPERFAYYWSANKDLERVLEESKHIKFALDSLEQINFVIDSTHFERVKNLELCVKEKEKVKKISFYKSLVIGVLLFTLLL